MKEYPLRKDIGDELQDICECGHAVHYHKDECEECEENVNARVLSSAAPAGVSKLLPPTV